MTDHQSITMAGIDVGGTNKGFHTVLLRYRLLQGLGFDKAAAATDWCVGEGAQTVAVDASMEWKTSGRSLQAERELPQTGRKLIEACSFG